MSGTDPSQMTTIDEQPGVGTLLPIDFKSELLKDDRKIVVYLPPGYSSSEERYPVIYAQDGQNLFDPKTSAFGVDWELNQAGDKGVAAQKIRPFIAVGVYNSRHRVDEYTPTPDSRFRGGKAHTYLQFLTDELKPYIDTTYRSSATADETIVLGSSLGGLFSLYAGWNRADVFGKIAALSPSLWWAGRDLISAFGGVAPELRPSKIYLDMGTRESNDDRNGNGVADVLDDLRTLRAVLCYHGYQMDQNLFYQEVKGAAHTEADWAKRISSVLELLLPAKPAG
jgi:predicted alpha/beta superfamily hydrolase